jgi:diguanylate cyclase (GGDEF)-like protein/PAS domain S-box-containing protein/putative nucleotidyltransferase with HDIG domain
MAREAIAYIGRKIHAIDEVLERWKLKINSGDSETEAKTGLEYLRDQAFYRIALLFAIFGLIPICYGAYIFYKEGMAGLGFLQILIYTVIVAGTFSRQLRVKTKRIIFIFGYYSLSLMLLVSVGPQGAGFLLVVSTLAIAGVLLSKVQNMGFVGCNIIIFCGLTLALYLGALDHLAISAYKYSWGIMALTAQVSGILLLIVIGSIYTSLEQQAITLQKSKDQIKESEEEYRRLFDDSGVGISYYSRNGLVVSYNQLAASILGGSPKDFEGKSLYDIFPKATADRYMRRIAQAIASDQSQEYEEKITLGDRKIWLVDTYSRMAKASGEVIGVQIASLDITDRKKLEKDLTYSSNYDFLTGLYNRRCFEEQMTALDQEGKLPLSLIMADVNGLKLINDSFGHKEGDQLLAAAARALEAGCGKGDIAARIGGGEFAILMPGADGQQAEEAITKISEEIRRKALNHSVLSISFGYASKNDRDDDIHAVYVEAENQMYKQKIYESSSMRSKTIDVIMNSLYEKSQRELSHSKRVGWLCAQVAQEMGFSGDGIKMLELAGLVHDIGKIGVEEKILNKPGALDDSEWDVMKNHPEAGWRILSSVHEFSEIADFILAHHEKWDGTGYPNGLKGEAIPLEARIIAVVDAFDAMTSQRSYRAPMEAEKAVAEIKRCAGSQFDPRVVEAFLQQQARRPKQVELSEAANFSTIKQTRQNGHASHGTKRSSEK